MNAVTGGTLFNHIREPVNTESVSGFSRNYGFVAAAMADRAAGVAHVWICVSGRFD
jgi:hypothetical protein